MKVQQECIPCQLENAIHQASLAMDDDEEQFEALLSYLDFIVSNFSRERTPAYYGYVLNRIIGEEASVQDLYYELKKKSNETAQMLLGIAKEFVSGASGRRDRLRRALKVSAAANSMEFGVSGHEFDSEYFKSEFKDLLHEDFVIDDSDVLASKVLSSGDVFFLADNAGEIVLDKILLNEIKEFGGDIYVGLKTRPVQEDVTVEEAKELGISEYGELVPTGGKIGIFPEDIPDRAAELLQNSELIVAKGMGNYETISEFEEKFEGRLFYILRAKCIPVARALGVKQGSLIVKCV
ncbi:MAG: damage-control phosphatase ARMT1 family protein [Candidatus Hadarchaeota archaeon]